VSAVTQLRAKPADPNCPRCNGRGEIVDYSGSTIVDPYPSREPCACTKEEAAMAAREPTVRPPSRVSRGQVWASPVDGIEYEVTTAPFAIDEGDPKRTVRIKAVRARTARETYISTVTLRKRWRFVRRRNSDG
jgi:hypothetical protein